MNSHHRIQKVRPPRLRLPQPEPAQERITREDIEQVVRALVYHRRRTDELIKRLPSPNATRSMLHEARRIVMKTPSSYGEPTGLEKRIPIDLVNRAWLHDHFYVEGHGPYRIHCRLCYREMTREDDVWVGRHNHLCPTGQESVRTD